MSKPAVPTDSNNITREEAINQILVSIAMEELGLSHILNAEGEKLQYILGTLPSASGPSATIEQILEANESVKALLESTVQNQMILKDKMIRALSAPVLQGPTGATGPTGPSNGITGATGVTGATGICGNTGSTGMTGNTGVTGATGLNGATGATGATGSAGAIGTTGNTGTTGVTGATGSAGVIGTTGNTGSAGAIGTTGNTGVTGVTGATGSSGAIGTTGNTGVTGSTGAIGTTGATGNTGATGVTGVTGSSGAIGSTGNTGATGVAGSIGATGTTGNTGVTGVAGSIGATGTTGNTGVTGATGASVTSEGFSAVLSTLTLSAGAQLTGWAVASPYFSSGNFNVSTGNYTVPTTGRYMIYATINYSTTAALSASLGSNINPAFVIKRTSPTTTNLITGLFPVLNVNIALVLTLRAVLGSGTVTLAGEVQLNAGDVVGLYYVDSGLGLSLNLGGASNVVVWSINQIN